MPAHDPPDYLWHYTTSDFAREVRSDLNAGREVFIDISDGIYGPGLYALDLSPMDADRDQLRWECFDDFRSEHPMDGVIKLLPALSNVDFQREERHIWRMPGPAC